MTLQTFRTLISLAAAVIVTTFALIHPAGAGSDVLEQRNVAGWTLTVVGDGTAAICLVGKLSPQKILFSFILERDRKILAMLLDGADAGWQLKPGSAYEVTFTIDDDPPVAAKAFVETETSIAVPFAFHFAEMAPLRRARTVEFRAAQQTFWFDLKGSAAALDVLQDCAHKHLGL